jgi:hypothetical protein
MSSERRGAELLLLDSIGAFRSVLLKVMVAVRRRWLQRGCAEGAEARQETARGRHAGANRSGSTADGIGFVKVQPEMAAGPRRMK